MMVQETARKKVKRVKYTEIRKAIEGRRGGFEDARGHFF